MGMRSRALVVQPIAHAHGQLWQVVVVACRDCPFLPVGIYRDAIRMWQDIKKLARALDLDIYELNEVTTDEILVL